MHLLRSSEVHAYRVQNVDIGLIAKGTVEPCGWVRLESPRGRTWKATTPRSPSQDLGACGREEALKRKLNARMEYAKFLQETVKEMAKEIQNSRSGEIKKTAEDLDEFMNKVRTGARVSNDEILDFAQLFNDELTLDNISRWVDASVSEYVQIYGYQSIWIKDDDKVIQAEGMESLSEQELRQACRDRGLLGLRSVEEMQQQFPVTGGWWDMDGGSGEVLQQGRKCASRDSGMYIETSNQCIKSQFLNLYADWMNGAWVCEAHSLSSLEARSESISHVLKFRRHMRAHVVEFGSVVGFRSFGSSIRAQCLHDWLDLSLNRSVPSSLLILSRAFTVPGKVKPEEAVQATLSSLPDEVVDTVGVTALPSEDSVSERRRKLEFLEMQEELIKEEEEKEEEEQARMKESAARQKDIALDEMITATEQEAQGQAQLKTLEKQEQLCEISRALAVLASASSVSREREEFLRLVNKEIELYNSMAEKEGTEGEEETKKAYRAAREDSDHGVERAVGDSVSSALIDRVRSSSVTVVPVDAMLQKLEKEIDDVDAKIGDRWRLLDRDYDGKVTPEEVASAAIYLKDTLGKEGIQELISSLSKDREGKIRVEDIVRLGSRGEDADIGQTGKVETDTYI
ncbi:LETM1-like protein [Actinidia rufa]|uniref:Mitochondrial proton/calcium exchanger protein n=1 Tax=Actinidia rufa TaxID=165716 RepID=A0A7J0GKN0_9ERIC|nr:LETM1-like protein [Actinidia rufa]